MTTAKKQSGPFKVGEWVQFQYGTWNPIAQVIEARGPLGANRRHLYRIRLDREAEEPDSFELPEDALQAVPVPDKPAIMAYLKNGGLVKILHANLGGGQNQPKVWLTYTPQGAVTHTFNAERGMIGGAKVPFFALHEKKVFTAKQEEVIAFLAKFGLTRAEADKVLRSVGTAP